MPLKAKGLKKAEGACPNALLEPAVVRQPVVQQRVAEGVTAHIPTVYEYDLETKAGETYIIN